MLSQREQEMVSTGPNPDRQKLTDPQNQTLQEALDCISCPIHLSKADMDRDMRLGTYDPSRDPPFLWCPRSRPRYRSSFSDASDYSNLHHDHDHAIDSDYASIPPDDHDHDGEEVMDIDADKDMDTLDDPNHDDDVSPLDSMPKPIPRARYASLTTPSQRQQYQARVLEALSELIGPLVGHTDDDRDGTCSPRSSPPPPPPPAPQTLSDVQDMVDEDDIRFACYRVDYHIYLHERARSSMLSMCRDIDDVWQLRGWQTEVRQLDREVLGMEPQETRENGLLDVHLMTGWRRAWRAREKRVHEVKKTWAGIVAERKRQRARMLRERRDHGGKIRFYTREEGNRVLLREFSL